MVEQRRGRNARGRASTPSEDRRSRVPGKACQVITAAGLELDALRDLLQAKLTEHPADDNLAEEVRYLRTVAAGNQELSWTLFVGLERMIADLNRKLEQHAALCD